jgi:ABC-type branched-subunit amino acid transport system substrate-binding protein
VAANKQLAAGIGIAVVLALIGVVAVAGGAGDDDKDKSAVNVDAGQDNGGLPSPGDTVETTTTVAGQQPVAGQATTTTAAGTKSVTLPGQSAPAPPCTPKDVKQTGISKSEVVIGQIVSDVSVLPAQLYPNYEGLQAYVNVVNQAGGVCGRKLRIEYSNDQSNPATHDYQSMTHKVFAFVGNSSLMDNTDYQTDAPFNPLYQDNGEYVPDVGGLAYSYGRSQSQWFAGNLGSLSPSLTGGAAIKWIVDKAKADNHPCKNAGVVYLREPTGASEDQGKIGVAALAADWGGGFGADHVKTYVANLADPVVVYEQMVTQMVTEGVNCVFTYDDLGSNINLVKAMVNRGVWPKDKCSGPQCMSSVYVPFAAYDPKFIRDAGDGAKDVITFIPHIPLNETSSAPMQQYLNALKSVKGAEPSTFSLIGWSAGQMFVQALQSCGAAPTRKCVMDYLRNLKDYDAAGLQGPVTPFRSTRVDCSGGCGNFGGHGTYNFKWIFPCNVGLQVQDRNGKRDFYRVNPASGYACDELRVARGKAA